MNKPKIIFRADASATIGYGHLVRSLALAGMLKYDFHLTFATREPTESIKEQILQDCDEIIVLDNDKHLQQLINMLTGNEIVVLDNYFFTTEYQRQIKAKGAKLVCIDDMHDKHYVADVVINHGISDPSKFSIEPYTKLCLGLEWALLRKPFRTLPKQSYHRQKGHIAIAFGGSDIHNLTEKYCNILAQETQVTKITAIVGEAYEHLTKLKGLNKVEVKMRLTAGQMAEMFRTVEFAILPTSTICIEAIACNCPVYAGYYVDNQIEYYKELKQQNRIHPLSNMLKGHTLQLDNTHTHHNAIVFNNYTSVFKALSLNIVNYVDMNPEQNQQVWQIRNLPQIRECMTNPNPFSFESHCNFVKTLKNSTTKLYWAIFQNNEFVGAYYVIGIHNKSGERGLFLNPEYWGKGYAETIEHQLFCTLKQQYKITTLRAEIKQINAKSLSYHHKLGYTTTSKENQTVLMSKII